MSVNNDLNFDLFIPQVAYIQLQELWNIAYKLYKTNFMIYSICGPCLCFLELGSQQSLEKVISYRIYSIKV